MKDKALDFDRRATWYQVTSLGRKYLEMLEELILPSVSKVKEANIPDLQPSDLSYQGSCVKQPVYSKKV